MRQRRHSYRMARSRDADPDPRRLSAMDRHPQWQASQLRLRRCRRPHHRAPSAPLHPTPQTRDPAPCASLSRCPTWLDDLLFAFRYPGTGSDRGGEGGGPVLFTPAEFNFETMRRHWIGLSRFHWRLEGFLMEIGLGKLPWSEKMDW